mmetsp:Transcript_44119/g.109619  ORF Transcript_44119/g.109619 Transcript_44119/m.109619 type:complete len:234 (+) Transcript_44119:2373-3074(+)
MHSEDLGRAGRFAVARRGGALLDDHAHLLGDRPVVRQLEEQSVDVRVVQVGGARAEQRDHAAGDRGGHIGIAVAITAHPAGDLHGRGVVRQRREAVLHQHPVDAAVVLGEGAPQSLFDHRHPIASLALRRRLRAADARGAPRGAQLALDELRQPRELSRRPLGGEEVVLLEQLDDALVLEENRTPLRLGGVGGEDEVDLLRDERVADGLRRDARVGHLVVARLEGGERRALVC